MSHVMYVQEAVRNCEAHLVMSFSGRFRLSQRADNPFKTGCDQDLYISLELEPDAASYFKMVVGNLSWMIKLGRINIITEVSSLSFHVALPREGHLDAAVHVVTYDGQKY